MEKRERGEIKSVFSTRRASPLLSRSSHSSHASHLVVVQVPQRLLHRRRGQDVVQRARHIKRNDQAGEQEEGPAIVARPVPVGRLEGGIKGSARVQGGRGGGLVRGVPARAGWRGVRAWGGGGRRRCRLEAEQGVSAVLDARAGGCKRGARGVRGRHLLGSGVRVVLPHLAAGVAVQGGQVGVVRAGGGLEPPHAGSGRERGGAAPSMRENRRQVEERRAASLFCFAHAALFLCRGACVDAPTRQSGR